MLTYTRKANHLLTRNLTAIFSVFYERFHNLVSASAFVFFTINNVLKI